MTSFGPDRLQSILPEPRGREKSAVKSAFGLLVQWYRRPDQFDSFNRYLATKGLELAVRLLVIGSLTTVIIAMTMLRFSDAGVHSHVTSVVNAVIIAVTGAVIVLFCLLPEITRRWSYFFVAYCEVGVFVGVFLNSDPFIGLIQCVLFVLIGGYIAYFHNARLQAFHMAFSIVVLALIGRKVAIYADPALATALCLIIATGIVVIPFACQFVLSLLGSDADSSDVDPLTGLLNRRGLQRAVVEMGATGRASSKSSYVVAIVDVDSFKIVNDSHGHEEGDLVLRQIADRLRWCGSENALFARFGGDEFVLVDTIDVGAAPAFEDSLRRHLRIDDRDPAVTTSVGVAITSAEWSSIISDEELTDLFRIADASMYRAKAAGGDQVVMWDGKQ
ncbi:GGDEF domain-containing protein [Rhodococcus erythropolis]